MTDTRSEFVYWLEEEFRMFEEEFDGLDDERKTEIVQEFHERIF